jgi:4-amino-4-deoxy-L-arabinose transferase-like glycosyltransferase
MAVPPSEGAAEAENPRPKAIGVWSWLAANKPLVLLVALCVVMLATSAAAIVVHRKDGAMNIDEAGYLSMSVTDYSALRSGGPVQLVRSVLSQPTQAPLVPLLSSLVYAGAGRPSVVGAYAVQLLALLLLILTAYAIGAMLAGRWAGLVAALTVTALPIVLNYVRDYMFALPAAAAAMVALWAALRSDLLQRKWFTVVWGAALGAMILSRTMTIAFLPGFALVAILQLFASPRRRRSLTGLACGLAAGLVVAGPWYVAQGRSVWVYLTSFGYGAASTNYGAARSVFSPQSWLISTRDNLNNYVWLPLALVLIAGLVALVALVVARLLRTPRPRLRVAASSPWLYLVVVAVTGVVAMQSSRNNGTGFPAPILPVVMILAVAAIARSLRGRRAAGAAALAAIALLCAPSLSVKTAVDTDSGQPVTLTIPGITPLVVVDGRSDYLMYTSVMPRAHRDDPDGDVWRTANDSLRAALDELGTSAAGRPVLLSFGQRLVNSNTLLWEELMTHGASPPIWLLAPSPDGATGYSGQLDASLPDGGTVLVCSDPPSMIDPVLDQDEVRAGLTTSGFALAKTVTLPDGAAVEIWMR